MSSDPSNKFNKVSVSERDTFFNNLRTVAEEKKKIIFEELDDASKYAQEKYDAICKLLELSSGTAVLGHHMKASVGEEKQAKIWRGVSIGALVVAAFWVAGIAIWKGYP